MGSLTLMLAAPAAVAGQAPAPTSDPVLTLEAWADDVWVDVLDREGTFRGRLAPEGIFQRFNPDMDHEYALDVRTGMFQPWEDVAWAGDGGGLRVAGASVSHPHILNRLDWRHAYPVSGGLDLTADYTRDHSLTDRRDYARVGLRWTPEGAAGWSLGSRVGVHFFKPEADVEVEVTRAWGARHGGVSSRWRATARVAALDVFNDVVFVSLGVDPDEVEAHLDHEGVPLAGRLRLEGRGTWWRFEAHAAATTERRARVTFPGAGEGARGEGDAGGDGEPFELEERVAFAGALLELRPLPDLSMAGHARVAEARTDRRRADGGTPGSRIRERSAGLGGIVRWTLRDAVHAEGEVDVVWRPEDRSGAGERVEHDDRAVYGVLGLVRRSARGWTARVAYTTLDRRAGVLLPEVGGSNARLLTEGGYRTLAGFRVLAGLRWDLDGRPVFDGAHLRLAAGG